MPWNAEHKEKSKEKILSSTTLLFTRKGFDEVSIDDVMREAGLTRGAFYSHFKSKSDIYNQAIIYGAKKARAHISDAEIESVMEFAENYLKIGTGEIDLQYCTLAFLITDINQRDKTVKSTYTKVLQGYHEVLESLGLTKSLALQISVLLIGGLALSRTVTDKNLKSDILNNCLQAIRKLVDDTHGPLIGPWVSSKGLI